MANQKLLSYLEILGPQQSTGCIKSWKPDTEEEGHIFLYKGDIIYARCGTFSSISAIFIMLAWHGAEVEFEREKKSPKINCNYKTDLIIFQFIGLEDRFQNELEIIRHIHSEANRREQRKTLNLPDIKKYALYLEVDHPDFPPVIYEIKDGGQLLGTDDQCDFQLQSMTVSKIHCRLNLVDQMLTVTDLGSTNGTYVQGRLIDHENVFTGDELILGDLCLQIKGTLKRKLARSTATVAIPNNYKNLKARQQDQNSEPLQPPEITEDIFDSSEDNTRTIHWKNFKKKPKSKGLFDILKKK
ncbi:MAG: FHA domain-containing protein [Verrucomicrobiota bacterium]